MARRMKSTTGFALGCAFLIGVGLAFPAGLMVAGRVQSDPAPAPRAHPRHAAMMNPYSPNITQDPYFVEQQRQGLQALERSCRETGKFCNEAAQLRQWLVDRGATP